MERLPVSVATLSDVTQNQGCTLWMLLQGEADCTLEAQDFRMTRSDVLFLSPEQTIQMCFDRSKGDLLILQLLVDESFLLEHIDLAGNQILCNSALVPGNYTQLRQIISELTLALATGGRERHLHSMALCYELMDALTDFFVPIPREPEKQRKQEILRYIRRHYREPLSLTSLAEAFYLSPQYLSRYIKVNFGEGFLSILTGVRLDGAVRALQEGKNSVTQIALDSGFPNVSSFNSAFRKRFGVSPRSYLKRLQQPERQNPELQDMSTLKVHLEEFLPHLTAASTGQEVSLSVQVNCGAGSACRDTWRTIINLEQASSLLDNAVQNHVIRMQDRLHFSFGRIVNLLSPAVFPGLENGSLSNFTYLNRIIDFLLSVKLKPFIELQPKLIRKPVSANTIRVQEPPSISESNWNRYMHELFSYLCKRWGEEEVETWRFELWLPHNEALEISSMEIRRYVRRFRATMEILKGYIPDGKLGGPGLNLGGSSLHALEDVLSELKTRGVTPDFYSAYLFPAYLSRQSGDAVTFSRIIGGDADSWPELLHAFRETVAPEGKELFLTEYGTDVTDRAGLNDTGYKAAVLVRSFLQLGTMTDGMGYWHLSDLSYDVMDSNILLFGGNGMISRNGIPKSVYHAFTLLARQGKTLVAMGGNYMVTRRNHRHYEVLVHNCKSLSEVYRQELFAAETLDPEQVFSDVRPLRMHLTLSGIRSGNYTVQKYAIEGHYGDLSEAVRAFGCPFVMREEEREYLIHTSVPRQSMETIACQKTLSMEILLGPNAVALYTLVFDD